MDFKAIEDQIKAIPGNEAVLTELLTLLDNGEGIALVGAGASAELYPLWTSFLNGLVNFGEQHGRIEQAAATYYKSAAENSPLETAEQIKTDIGDKLFFKFLKDTFKDKKSKQTDKNYTLTHKALLELPINNYLTLNYDPGLTNARADLYPESSSSYWIWEDEEVIEIGQNNMEKAILHAHGRFDKKDSIVLTLNDYRKVYKEGAYLRLLNTLFAVKKILFVGFGMTDPYIKELFNQVNRDFQQTDLGHIALIGLAKDEMANARFLRQKVELVFGAKILFYPSENYHQALSDWLLAMANRPAKKKVKFKKEWINPFIPYFEIKPIQQVTAKDLLETRAEVEQGFSNTYFQRPYLDAKLKEHIAANEHTVIYGKPLAGKSRAVYQAISDEFKALDYDVWFAKRKPIELGEFKLPENSHRKVIVIFNDIQAFLDVDNFKLLISKLLLMQNVVIIATCRKSFQKQLEILLADYLHNFKGIEIKALSFNEKRKIKLELPKSKKTFADDTIGSFFLPLDIMRGRFKQLPEESLEVEIFRTCKLLRLWGRTLPDFSYDLATIKEYCHKRYENYYGKTANIPPVNWVRATRRLEELRLIYQSDNSINIEEVYLEKFYDTDDQNLFIEIANYYPSLSNKHRLLLRATSYQTAFSLFKLIGNEFFKWNVVSYNILMNKSSSFKEAKDLLDLMKKESISPDEVTLNTLMNKASSFEEAKDLLDLMKKEGISPDEVTLNTLMNKSSSFEEAKDLLDLMKKEGISPDEVTLNTLMNKSSSFEEAKDLLDLMEKEGICPNEVSYSTLMNKASSFEEAKDLLDLMKEEGISPNEVTYSTLMNKTSSFKEAKGLLDLMKKEGISPDEVTLNTLMNKTSSFEEAKDLLDLMKKEGISPDEVTLNTLMNKASSFEEAKDLLDLMKKEGISPDEVSYSTLMNKASSFEEGKNLLDLMKKEGISPDEVSYSTLMNKASSFEEGKNLLDLMKEEGISPNEVTLNTLMNKASSFKEAKNLLDLMKKEGISPDEVTLNTLMNKASSFEEAKNLLDLMKKEGISPDEVTLNTLMNKASSFEGAKALLDLMRKDGIQADNKTLTTLVKIAQYTPIKAFAYLQAILTEEDIFSDIVYNYIIVHVYLPNTSEALFFAQNFECIAKQSDEIIRFYAEHTNDIASKMKLAKQLKVQDWNYYKIIGDAMIGEDFEESEALFNQSMALVPEKFKPIIWTLLAKNIIFNQQASQYSIAENYCRTALKQQNIAQFPFSLKLLLLVILLQSDNDSLRNVLKGIIKEFKIGRKSFSKFRANLIEKFDFLPPEKVEYFNQILLSDLFPLREKERAVLDFIEATPIDKFRDTIITSFENKSLKRRNLNFVLEKVQAEKKAIILKIFEEVKERWQLQNGVQSEVEK